MSVCFFKQVCVQAARLRASPTRHDRYLIPQMIKTPELEQALLVLPFSQVESLANFLVRLLAAGLEVELCARCAVFLLRVHQASLGAHAWQAQSLDRHVVALLVVGGSVSLVHAPSDWFPLLNRGCRF